MRGARVAVTVAAAALLLLLAASMLTGAAAAQDGTEPVNQTLIEEQEFDSETLYQLESATIQEINFEDRQAELIIYMEIPGTVVVQDQSTVGMTSGGTITQQSIQLSGGTHRVTMDLNGNNHRIAVIQGSRGEVVDRGMAFGILEGPVTVGLVQIGVVGGASGIFGALLFAVRNIRRDHDTSYKEVFSGEKIRIQDGEITDWRDRVLAEVMRHWLPVTLASLAFLWLVFAWLGALPSPGEAWGSMGDHGRVFTIGAILTMTVGYIPTKYVAYKLWAPAKEFVIALDSTGVFDNAADAGFGDFSLQDDLEAIVDELRDKDAIKQIEVWAGSPENVNEIRCDAGTVDVNTRGGRGHLVKEFDPANNVARGTWPGMADDMELVLAAAMTWYNRSVAQDYMVILKRVIGALPSLKTQSNLNAVISMDAAFRKESSADSAPMDGFLNDAAEGTVFEGYWGGSDGGDGDEDEEQSEKSPEDAAMKVAEQSQSNDGDNE